jgi:hypothetical protein
MRQYLFFIVYGIFVVVNILDCVTTVRALKNGAMEANPLMKKAMTIIGVIPALVIMKIIALGVVAAAYVFVPPVRAWMPVIIGLFSLAYAAVVFNNYRISNQ